MCHTHGAIISARYERFRHPIAATVQKEVFASFAAAPGNACFLLASSHPLWMHSGLCHEYLSLGTMLDDQVRPAFSLGKLNTDPTGQDMFCSAMPNTLLLSQYASLHLTRVLRLC